MNCLVPRIYSMRTNHFSTSYPCAQNGEVPTCLEFIRGIFVGAWNPSTEIYSFSKFVHFHAWIHAQKFVSLRGNWFHTGIPCAEVNYGHGMHVWKLITGMEFMHRSLLRAWNSSAELFSHTWMPRNK